jgi:hypothetical protein
MVSTMLDFSMKSKQVAEYSWEEDLQGKVYPMKVRVFYQPFGIDLNTMKTEGKYNTSVFIGGDWQIFVQFDYEPSLIELKARVAAEMPTWKALGVI